MTRRFAALWFAVGCGGSSTPATPVGSRVGPALTAALAAFDEARAPLQCSNPGLTLADEMQISPQPHRSNGERHEHRP